MKKIGINSYFYNQILLRYIHITKLIKILRTKDMLVIWLVGSILTDIILGNIYFYKVYAKTLPSELYTQFYAKTVVLANDVQNLLEWLKGAPAGLKLNQPLSEALSCFFSYHVYLWTIYIDFASPLLGILSYVFIYCGIFGISFQIALLADFLNLAVLHIHCFYIYAARLHMVQISCLGSQWRAFRGQKWNPLKQRIDARNEVKNRPIVKILSAVGFTFVIFLLPTTSVFYTVFVVLRLILLCVQGITSLFLWILNSNPVGIICLYMIGSSSIKCDFHYDMEPMKENIQLHKHLILNSSTRIASLTDVLNDIYDEHFFPSLHLPNMGKMLHNLIYAKDLI